MKERKLKKRLIVGGALVLAALVVFSVVGFLLADAKVFNVNPFKLMLSILSLGMGVVFLVYAIIVKGGYEYAVGAIFAEIGIIIVLIGLIKWYAILIIALALIIVLFLAGIALKANELIVERTRQTKDDLNGDGKEDTKTE